MILTNIDKALKTFQLHDDRQRKQKIAETARKIDEIVILINEISKTNMFMITIARHEKNDIKIFVKHDKELINQTKKKNITNYLC
jgi:hypothetical protein